ncbi:PAQR family membrane homeostasis protein TrhA [Limimaricola cinnabarinus]|uniref:Predicted membrane protein hemolysin III homolog n=1 Tax=Limimaricola cinnabarinus LL-001 TaxID=1337093 RepID=U3AG85_9RHOB|nr:hemolysin III family protein [Limimaricola cinnabarinus]GAD56709.1 predicted membrane protein hemolysin III homolog [Limimaricola cinnabarinus LL-001]
MTPQHEEYPAYARSERIADGMIHALGVIFALAGAILLVSLSAWSEEARIDRTVAVAIYGGALIATFSASAFYHMTPWTRLRPLLRRIDHAAIYFKIAGTYTPLVVLIGSAFAYAILAVVWAIALGGAVAKLFFWKSPGRLGPTLYLLMGWLSIALVWSLAMTLPVASTALVVIGGLLYSAGVIFFVWEGLRFSNAIWHGFVLAASACFFAAIAMGVLG